jgi:hypothetical protein
LRVSDRLLKAVLTGRAHALAVGKEAVGIDNRHALFALAHMVAGFERLAKDEPALCAEAALDEGNQRMSTLTL